MKVSQKEYRVNGYCYTIRPAVINDAKDLYEIRLQIDGETQNLDREQGESYINKTGFEEIIKADTEEKNNLFLVSVISGNIVGFSRCEGNHLKRFIHKVEFGVCVLKDYWRSEERRVGKECPV